MKIHVEAAIKFATAAKAKAPKNAMLAGDVPGKSGIAS